MPRDLETDEVDAHESQHPPLPGNKAHNCTDLGCLFIFLSCLGGLIYINVYARQHGDLRKLFHGYNTEKQLCGLDPPVAKANFLYYCHDPKTASYYLDDPQCLDECPTVGYKDLPANTSSKVCPTVGFQYASYAIGSWCLPAHKGEVVDMVVEMTGNSTTSIAIAQWKDAKSALPVTGPVVTVMAVVTGYTYLLLLRNWARALVYASEAMLVGGVMAVGAWFIQSATSHAPMFAPAYDLPIGIGFLVLGLITLVVFCVRNRGLATALGCIQATCECMFDEVTLFVEPMAALAIKLLNIAVMAVGLALTITTGEVQLTGNTGIKRRFEYTLEQQLYIVVYIFMSFWLVEFHHAASQYVLAWVTQMWYFTPYIANRKLDRKPCGILRGYCNMLRFHVGTLALGSLLVGFLRIFRVSFGLLAASAGNTNSLCACVLRCCFCCIYCFEHFLDKLNKEVYMDVAVTSSSYVTAASRANQLMKEVPAIGALNNAQTILQICGVGLVVSVSVWLNYAMTNLPVFSDPKSKYFMTYKGGSCVIAGLIAAFVSVSFMLVFDTVGDTILYCFATEQRRQANLLDRHKYSDRKASLSTYEWLFGSNDLSEDEDPHVEYAPTALKKLVDEHG